MIQILPAFVCKEKWVVPVGKALYDRRISHNQGVIKFRVSISSEIIMKIINILLAIFLVTVTASAGAEPPAAPSATLAFELIKEERGPLVAHLFNGKPDKKCKGKGLISSISRGNPFVRTKNNEGVSIPASTPQKYFLILVPATAYLSCKWTVSFTPKVNERYTIIGKYSYSGYDQRSCTVNVLEGDKPLATDQFQVEEC